MYWSLRRELWENRSIYTAPLAAALVFLFGFSLSTLALPRRLRDASLDPAKLTHILVTPFSVAPALIIVTAYIVGAFYCIEALFGERRDRSILFWKSLPVSDLTTVLSKASIPLVILPLVAMTISLVTQLIMLFEQFDILGKTGVGKSESRAGEKLKMTLKPAGNHRAVNALGSLIGPRKQDAQRSCGRAKASTAAFQSAPAQPR
jgi:ABC-2 type transport system permease protein